ncbi:D-sedoheptulose-7-phosphate isomerase [Dictyobacter aurantiacus]|uniref:Phosphoheptose isomerase n=1 Tax=Dictyobacter aurantiacus TaxID=1936993 RepID=A0A401Z7A5_9CHLR|nr:SIS domain-containing protein [Dictyobacter aurantiacus]GCE02747.1 phosphoheptose isomerase [Dictyobacter aurantiacus]
MDRKSRISSMVTTASMTDSTVDWEQKIKQSLTIHHQVLENAFHSLYSEVSSLAQIVQKLIFTLQSGHRVLVIGNGGSAAEAQHFASELVGRFKLERKPYAVIALTTDTSILTAIANDYGYQDVFMRQVYALGQPGDMLLVFSTSGESPNVLSAIHAAEHCQMQTVAITGTHTNQLAHLAQLTVGVAQEDVATIQEIHMVVTHLLCNLTEACLASQETPR